MKVNGTPYHTIWHNIEEDIVQIIDQRLLPHRFVIENLRSTQDVTTAIRDMHVRGAPLIGAAAAYGMYFATCEADTDDAIDHAAEKLLAARPTAVNLEWAVRRAQCTIEKQETLEAKRVTARANAEEVLREELERSRRIGEHGLPLLAQLAEKKRGEPLQILTHCNAGWLACIDYGTATAPIYLAHDANIPLHVWVDETRPRNQGARLTAWELGEHGVPHTVIADNTGGHLMQHGMVDLVIVGTDRTTKNGDVANKIGTYLKALAAHDNKVPFYVALPSSSMDWELTHGDEIAIEERTPDEVSYIYGLGKESIDRVRITPQHSPALNYAFDVTPARLITAFITDQGISEATPESLAKTFSYTG